MNGRQLKSIELILLAAILFFPPFSIAQQQTEVSGAAQPSAAQSCKLTLNDAPAVRGIRFGMSKDEAEKALGIKMLSGSALPEDRQIGIETLTFFRVSVNRYPQQLDGVRFIELNFFNNQLYDFTFSFDDSTTPDTIADFSARLSSEYSLPQSWENDGSSMSRMSCQGFEVEANIYFLPEISLTNNEVNQEIEHRRREYRANQLRRTN